MDVKKIFTILITIVACVIIGAFLLNIVMPNAINGVTTSIENMIFKATKLQLDLNGDGTKGNNVTAVDSKVNNTTTNIVTSGGVAGWG